MLCYGAKDLARAYRTVRENTVKAAEEIPESQLDFAPAPGTRTIRQLLTHIALTDSFSELWPKLALSAGAELRMADAPGRLDRSRPVPDVEAGSLGYERTAGEESRQLGRAR